MSCAVSLFNRAKIVIAPHGAGTSNIMFCTKEAILVELCVTGQLKVQSMAVLASSLGVGYIGVPVQGSEHREPMTVSPGDVVWHTALALTAFEQARQVP